MRYLPRVAKCTVIGYISPMPDETTSKRSVRTGKFAVSVGKGRGSNVRFGDVVVRGARPSAASVKTNIARSTEALERVTKALTKPGVVIRAKKDVPQFSVAEGEPGIFIRKLNRRVERGRLVNGVFQVID